MTPGFQGLLTKTVTHLGAPAGCAQAISLFKTCQPISVGIIHHEVGHVLGKIHEVTRPDKTDPGLNEPMKDPIFNVFEYVNIYHSRYIA